MNSKITIDIKSEIEDKSIAILGFGREGRSTYNFLRKIMPYKLIYIIDLNTKLENDKEIIADTNVKTFLGKDYLLSAINFDVIFKSPGISFVGYTPKHSQKIYSQADIFLRFYGRQTIGVTGTKGKSTTVSLLKHILDSFYLNVLLIGNIGIPALDVIDKISSDTIIIFEMSSHQLEYIYHSPHIAVLLNLYQEHLDHYNNYIEYRQAKWNIAKFQSKTDFFIYSVDEKQVCDDIDNKDIKSNVLKYGFNINLNNHLEIETSISNSDLENNGFVIEEYKLLGKHNLNNLMASLLVVKSLGLSLSKAIKFAMTFKSLPHRLEFVGQVNGVSFYNDSIATIPEACIKALESIPNVETLILGGYNRGIDYDGLVQYFLQFKALNLILIGEVGLIIKEKLANSYKGNIYQISDFDDIINIALQITGKNKACLLSPAASSYDSFKNFEERGDKFKSLVMSRMI